MALIWKREQKAPEFTTGAPGAFGEHVKPTMANPPALAAPASAATKPAAAPPISPVSTPSPPPEAPMGFFGRIKSALGDRLKKTRDHLVGEIRDAIKAAGKVDADLLDRIEEILINADVGAETTVRIVDAMREFEARGSSGAELIAGFKAQLHEIVGRQPVALDLTGRKPAVVLVVGVNGVGKTTTIGKLAAECAARGQRVLIAAGDTFRAAAIEQLGVWADRAGATLLSKGMGADPAGLAFDAVAKATDEDFDVLLIDTAGRLHTKTDLMDELKKVHRVIGRVLPGAPHHTLLVLDATTGQNAISQARIFTEAVQVTELVMTKLDGTAKGGVLIGIRDQFEVPVVKIGVGEAIEDLRDFDPVEFVDGLFAEEAGA